jgi:hypothetical protein
VRLGEVRFFYLYQSHIKGVSLSLYRTFHLYILGILDSSVGLALRLPKASAKLLKAQSS